MSSAPPPLSFDRAQTPGQPSADACSFCGRFLDGDYYRIAGRQACPVCAGNAQALSPQDSHAAFSRALVFGSVAAVVACIAYGLITAALHFNIGYFAIGVGWVIGWAMHKGSGNIGGRRYQILALVLTYFAVSMSIIPTVMYEASQAGEALPAFPKLLGYGLFWPFLEFLASPGHALLNAIIIAVGMRFAWRFTAGKQIPVDGPFQRAA